MSEDKKPTTDTRFAGVFDDPKFREGKKDKLKIKLDDRFSKKDLEVKRKAKVDKYGRKIKGNGVNEKESKDFDKYFEKEDGEANKDDEKKEDAEDEKEETKAKVSTFDRARGEIPDDYVSSSDEFTSSDSENSDSELDEEDSDEEVELEKEDVQSGDATKTLAVVNLDWDHVKSTDLMITFSGFVPKGGKIESICIYPSEFGKERMQREEVEGPPRELFQKKKKKHSRKQPSDDESDDEINIKDLYEEGDAEKDVDSKALRHYQLERLRYYYAVVNCNNVETARSIYENCDSTEYESTANMFDIRYVPEGMSFDDEPRDSCDGLPKNYKPLNFSTGALQHSNVKLTWDETPADRVEISKRAFSQKEIDEMDFKAYLASDSDESEEEVDDAVKNKLKLLAGSSLSFTKPKSHKADGGDDAQDGDDDDVDMEITFNPALEEGAGDEKPEGEESTIDKIKRKEKERRKARKEKIKQLKHDAQQAKKEKFKSSKSKNGDDEKVNEKARAELELLMMDEDEADSKSTINKKAHFNMNEILRSEKEKKKKSKFQDKKRIVEDEFKPDLNDPRFKEVFEDRDFAIDPSQPEFKKTAAMENILKERSKRNKNKTNNKKRKHGESEDKKVSETKDIANIVSKLKRRKGKN